MKVCHLVLVCGNDDHLSSYLEFYNKIVQNVDNYQFKTTLYVAASCSIPTDDNIKIVQLQSNPNTCEEINAIFIDHVIRLYEEHGRHLQNLGIACLVKFTDCCKVLPDQMIFNNILGGAYSLMFDMYDGVIERIPLHTIPENIQKLFNIQRFNKHSLYSCLKQSSSVIAFDLQLITYRPPGFFRNIFNYLSSQDLSYYIPVFLSVDDIKRRFFGI